MAKIKAAANVAWRRAAGQSPHVAWPLGAHPVASYGSNRNPQRRGRRAASPGQLSPAEMVRPPPRPGYFGDNGENLRSNGHQDLDAVAGSAAVALVDQDAIDGRSMKRKRRRSPSQGQPRLAERHVAQAQPRTGPDRDRGCRMHLAALYFRPLPRRRSPTSLVAQILAAVSARPAADGGADLIVAPVAGVRIDQVGMRFVRSYRQPCRTMQRLYCAEVGTPF